MKNYYQDILPKVTSREVTISTKSSPKPKAMTRSMAKSRNADNSQKATIYSTKTVQRRAAKGRLPPLFPRNLNQNPTNATLVISTDTVTRIAPFIPTNHTGWVFYIQNAKLIETLSFSKFIQNVYSLDIQPLVSYIIASLTKLAQTYSIPLVIVNCQDIIDRCLDKSLLLPIPRVELLSCIHNNQQVMEFINKPGRVFLNGAEGMNDAAQTIQYYWARYKSRVARAAAELVFRAKRRIIKYIRLFKIRQKLLNQAKIRLGTEIAAFEKIQEKFLKCKEPNLISQYKVLVCICSQIDSSKEHNHVQRAFQLIDDEKLKVILVMDKQPYNLQEQVHQVFDYRLASELIESKRLQVVVTEVSSFLASNSKAAAALYFSQKALNEVISKCRGSKPIVIADQMSDYVAGVCKKLNCPFFGSSVSLSSRINKNPMEIVEWLKEDDIPLTLSEDSNVQSILTTMIHLGLQIYPNGQHKILANCSTTQCSGEYFGMFVPHRKMYSDEVITLIKKVFKTLLHRKYSGFATVTLSSSGIHSVIPHLNHSVLSAISIQTKNGLTLNQENLELELGSPWAISFLSKNPHADHERIKNEFEAIAQPVKSKVVYKIDTLQHGIFEFVDRALVALGIQKLIKPFDSWTVSGIEFPLNLTCFPIVCYGESEATVLESFLCCLAHIECFTERDCGFKFDNNLHKLSLNGLKQLQSCKVPIPIFNEFDFEDKLKPICELLMPIVGNNQDFPKQLSAVKDNVTEVPKKYPISVESMELVNQRVYYDLASEKDPSLLSPVPDMKTKTQTVKKTEAKASVLVSKLEILEQNFAGTAFIQQKWSKI